MTAIFISSEFGEALVGSSEPGAPECPQVNRLRLEIFYNEGVFEVFLIDRAYVPGREAQDINVTVNGVFQSCLEAFQAVDQFIADYNQAQEEHVMSAMGYAMNELLQGPNSNSPLKTLENLPLAA